MERRESTDIREFSRGKGSFILTGGYRLSCRARGAAFWDPRPPNNEPDRPKSFSPMLETVLDRLWLLGGSCRGVALKVEGNCWVLGRPMDVLDA